MIFKHRPPAPPIFQTSEVLRFERERMERFFLRPVTSREQTKYRIRYESDREIRNPVAKLFNFKCAYCEQPAQGRGGIDRFRPTQLAMGLDGRVSRDHYWWLHFEWNNLVWACPDCNRNKRNLFPVDGVRGSSESPEEAALLLDPCYDRPESHFTFNDAGEILGASDRGSITIQVLQLNRLGLVEQRREALIDVESTCNKLFHLLDAPGVGNSEKLILGDIENRLLSYFGEDSEEPFLLLRRQYVAHRMAGFERYADKLNIDWWRQALGRSVQTIVDVHVDTKRQVRRTGAEEVASHQIRRVEIYNFRSIEHLQLNVVTGGEKTSWLMLLGENGTGKTSVLRAIALAFMTPGQRAKSVSDASRCVRKGAAAGWVKVYLADAEAPLEFSFRSNSKHFSGSGPKVSLRLLGYGHTRLLGESKRPIPKQRPKVRVQSLFNPRASSVDAESWLLSLQTDRFAYVGMQVNEILGTDRTHVLEVNRGPNGAQVLLNGVPLFDHSSGYQSILALVFDIIMGFEQRFEATEFASGIILLDEVDAHLHPRWKLRIVDALRKAFPYVQFIVTSHEPLCLRGMEQGEVTVMVERGGHLEAWTDELPRPEGMEIDQLLTSSYFGLGSTVDPHTEELMSRYYRMLSLSQGEDQSAEIENLRKELDKLNARLLGATPREQLMYRAIDKFLAEQEARPKEQLEQMDEEFWADLRQLWYEDEAIEEDDE